MTRYCSTIASMVAAPMQDDDFDAEPIILLIGGDRQLIDASRSAGVLLDEAMILERNFGRLVAKSQGDMVQLERAIAEARWRGMSSLRLEKGGFEADIIRMGNSRSAPTFVILSRQLGKDGADRAERATKCFGLTPAENRLLRCLLEGLELKDAALRLGVARTTARTHLQRIFDKTGVRRQTDLQRMIALA